MFSRVNTIPLTKLLSEKLQLGMHLCFYNCFTRERIVPDICFQCNILLSHILLQRSPIFFMNFFAEIYDQHIHKKSNKDWRRNVFKSVEIFSKIKGNF